MTRYQCIREILDTFDFYDAFAARLDARTCAGEFSRETAGRAFRVRLCGYGPSRGVTESRPGAQHESRRAIFRRVYRAYVFKGVREGHAAGLDYLSICYALCRRIASPACGDRWAGFSLHTWSLMKTGQPLPNYADPRIGDPEKVSLKRKLAFLRAERLKRKAYEENRLEQPSFCL